MRFGSLILLALFAFSGCDIFGGGGGGGGNTGGGTGSINFTRGFTYARKDDRNVYVVNDSATDEPARFPHCPDRRNHYERRGSWSCECAVL